MEILKNDNGISYTVLAKVQSGSEKRFIPYHVSKEEAEEIVGETWIEPTYSAYDCTGRPFSASIDFYDVPGGTWIYHHVGYDF